VIALVAVFPANVWSWRRTRRRRTGNLALNAVRLPFQALFAAWAWWYTREDPEP
jgi:uncharacterized membrane protein